MSAEKWISITSRGSLAPSGAGPFKSGTHREIEIRAGRARVGVLFDIDRIRSHGARDARAWLSVGKLRIRVWFNEASVYGTKGARRLSLDLGWRDFDSLTGAGYRGGRTAWVGWKLRGGHKDHTGAPSWKIGNLSIGWFTRNANAVPYVG